MTHLGPISENSVTTDLKNSIDPFDQSVTSSLRFRISSLIPPDYQQPRILTKQERIDEYFSSNNIEPKEEILNSDYEKFLAQIDSILIQFFKDNPYRMRVFLTSENENGTRYFLSSFIRPSVLPLIASHTVELAAEFVANLCQYQILFDFFSPPRCIATANFTVASQKGDCFDMSVLLTTILTGIGYDAYVIVGYANRELTLSDLRYRKCPGIAENEQQSSESKGTENKYLKVIQGRSLKLESSFVDKQKNPAQPPPPTPVLPTPPQDEYEGRRMHCWVMVSSARIEIPETVFIDVSTGNQYPLSSSLFGYIEIAFNHKNVWINLQNKDFKKNDDTMDFATAELWKPVIEPESQTKIPSPVVSRLEISENQIFCKYPKVVSMDGCTESFMKKLLWNDALEELYAPYTKHDGLVRRFFIFGKGITDIDEIREHFQSLRQHLIERRVYLKKLEMHERFESGAVIASKDPRNQQIGERSEITRPISVISHKIKHNEWRLLEFDDTARLDRLKSRLEVFDAKIIEKFGDRDDGMMQRKIRIVPESSSSSSDVYLYDGGPKIERMTQKYRHPSQSTSHHTVSYALANSVYKVSFDFVTNGMKIVYHHQPGAITDFYIIFHNSAEKNSENAQGPESSSYCIDPPQFDSWTMNEIQNQLTTIKEKGKSDAARIAKEIVSWIRFRNEEESRPYLKMKSVDVVLHRKLHSQMGHSEVLVEDPPPEPKPEGEEESSKMQQQLSANDPLCVYFPLEPVEITQAVAEEIYRKAKASLIERLYKEIKNLQARLDEEQNTLKSKSRDFEMEHQHNRNKEKTEAFQHLQESKTFLIGVLERRIKRFEEAAQRRWFELITSLRNHPKLQAFQFETEATYQEARIRLEATQKSQDKSK